MWVTVGFQKLFVNRGFWVGGGSKGKRNKFEGRCGVAAGRNFGDTMATTWTSSSVEGSTGSGGVVVGSSTIMSISSAVALVDGRGIRGGGDGGCVGWGDDGCVGGNDGGMSDGGDGGARGSGGFVGSSSLKSSAKSPSL